MYLVTGGIDLGNILCACPIQNHCNELLLLLIKKLHWVASTEPWHNRA